MAFLHGVEVIEVTVGDRPVTVVKSAVIAVLGVSPSGPKQALTLVQNATDAAQFGAPIPGMNIPQSLGAIQSQGGALCVVVNIWDETSMATAVTAETQTVTNRAVKTAFYPVGAAAPVVTDTSAITTYIAGTDYTIDAYGNISILNPAIIDTAVLKITYKKINASGITATKLIGAVDGTTGVKTGMKLYDDCFNLFGFTPKIIICPGYTELSAMATAMIAFADAKRCIALLDAPAGTTVANAIIGRGPSGSINFYQSSERAMLLYPHLQAYDPATNANIVVPYSAFFAGVMAATDNTDGYWTSPSNQNIQGITGVERNISAAIADQNSEANLLNASGITTIFSSFGTGYRTWGNRNASFPTSTKPTNFLALRRTFDIIEESLELATLQFMDGPINNALIDTIRETGNQFVRTLIGRGALLPGSAIIFDKTINTPTTIAAGQLIFTLVAMGPTPAERITYNVQIDISILQKLLA